MKVSFNGINNICVSKKEYSKYGAYVTPDNRVNRGDKHYTSIKVSCNLSDDENGKDLTMFKTALAKCGKRYEEGCINKSSPDRFELVMTRQDVDDNKGHVAMSDFEINGFDVLLNDRKTLPLFSYITALSRKISNSDGITGLQKECSNLINKSAKDEAVKFIELA